MSTTIDMIRGRLEEISRQLADIDVRRATLHGEQEELRVALKVIDRFGAEDELTSAPEPDLSRRNVEAEQHEVAVDESESGKKPPGTPTIPEMILEVLAVADLMDEGGLAPKDITTAIRQKWWPTARAESIGSIVWRMCNEGRVAKADGRYRLPPEPSGELFAKADAAAEPRQQEARKM